LFFFRCDRSLSVLPSFPTRRSSDLSPRELVARVRAVLRRSDRAREPSDVIRASGVTLDVARMRVEVDGRPIELTPTEFQILATLAREPGRIFTRSQLLDAVHGVAFESY